MLGVCKLYCELIRIVSKGLVRGDKIPKFDSFVATVRPILDIYPFYEDHMWKCVCLTEIGHCGLLNTQFWPCNLTR